MAAAGVEEDEAAAAVGGAVVLLEADETSDLPHTAECVLNCRVFGRVVPSCYFLPPSP